MTRSDHGDRVLVRIVTPPRAMAVVDAAFAPACGASSVGTLVARKHAMRRLRILTWAARADYLRSLANTSHDFLVVSADQSRSDHGGPAHNLHPIGADEARRQKIDLILFQRPRHYLDEQYEILGPAQRRAPKVYLEHEPPRDHARESRHVVSDTDVVVVHVAHFNRLMWDHGRTQTRVIEPGVPEPEARYGDRKSVV